MKPFEDSIPEEQGEKQEALTALLRRAYRQESFAESVQQETIRRVGERLAHLGESDLPLSEQQLRRTESAFFPQSQYKLYQYRPLRRIMNTIAAVLVVSILIGSTVLLLAQKMHAPARHPVLSKLASPTSATDSVDVQQEGVEMSMRVTPGPYFLGELVLVHLVLTNHTRSVLTLAGGIDPTQCGSSLFATQTGGTSPHYALYTMPVRLMFFCPLSPGTGPSRIPTGQTVTAQTYLLLTSSGNVTLSGNVSFSLSATSSDIGPNPLAGDLPTLHIYVAPQMPANRVLIAQQEGSDVVIQEPSAMQLVAQNYIICQDAQHLPWPSGFGYTIWKPLSTNVLPRPDCAGNNLTFALWKYAIGTEGYEVVQGQQGQYTGPMSP